MTYDVEDSVEKRENNNWCWAIWNIQLEIMQ